jgi:hypothetical protein
MATRTLEGLRVLLQRLGMADVIPEDDFVDFCQSPMDIYRAHLAESLIRITNVESKVAYDSIQWPGENADLMVVLPRLRIPKDEWDNLKERLGQEVIPHFRSFCLECGQLTLTP